MFCYFVPGSPYFFECFLSTQNQMAKRRERIWNNLLKCFKCHDFLWFSFLLCCLLQKSAFKFLNYTKHENQSLQKNSTMIACLDIFSWNNMFRIIREFINNEQREKLVGVSDLVENVKGSWNLNECLKFNKRLWKMVDFNSVTIFNIYEDSF